MKNILKQKRGSMICWLILMILCPGFSTVSLALEESSTDLFEKEQVPQQFSLNSYANLSELVAMICDDASRQFDEFFGSSVIKVRPFNVISDYRIKKVTILGITLADQMAAMINCCSVSQVPAEDNHEQIVGGMLEEMDGFLRIHIHGRNVYGERRAYVANVEMSEPIYRALHSYAESY
jgi:hypothetical protein